VEEVRPPPWMNRTEPSSVASVGPRSLVAALLRRFGVAHMATAEDALQEASLRALEHAGDVAEPEQLERWLLRVAGNWIVDKLRREHRHVAIAEAPVACPSPSASRSTTSCG